MKKDEHAEEAKVSLIIRITGYARMPSKDTPYSTVAHSYKLQGSQLIFQLFPSRFKEPPDDFKEKS